MGAILGVLVAMMGVLGAMLGVLWVQDGPKRPQDGPKRALLDLLRGGGVTEEHQYTEEAEPSDSKVHGQGQGLGFLMEPWAD